MLFFLIIIIIIFDTMIRTLLCWSENIKYLNTYASIWYLNTI